MRPCAVVVEGGLVPLALSSSFSGGFRLPLVDSNLLFHKGCSCVGWFRNGGIKTENYKLRGVRVRAVGNSGEDQKTPSIPIAPLQLESPTGQLLSQIMQTHPHLLPATIDQQIERLQIDRDAEKDQTPSGSVDLNLYRRIAKVKDKERQLALEEIMYCIIIQKFMDRDISLIPPVTSSQNTAVPVDLWPNQEKKLEAIHSLDALEMIQSHLSLVLGERFVGPLNTIVQLSKLKLGKLYAASIMYGYFLKRVDERFQLERMMKTLPTATKEKKTFGDLKPNPFWDMESMVMISSDGDNSEDAESSDSSEEGKSYRLRSYVMYLDAETLQRYATIRSKEAISLIEKQTQALFGRPDIRVLEDGSLDTSSDEVLTITFSGLTMLVLEAVAFGSFLWEAESYVESKYHFVNS